jgi:hypothetical protein
MSSHENDFSRYQVRSVEREAWAGRLRDGRARYFFDGLRFWDQNKTGRSRLLASWQAPSHGWWHKLECDCELCRR